MSNIFIIKNGENAGPFSADEINDQLQSGEIAEDAKGWIKGMGNWEVLSCDALKAAGVVIPSADKDVPATNAPSAPEPPAISEPEPASAAPEPEPTPEPAAPEPAAPAPAAPEPKPAVAAPAPAAPEPKPAAAAPAPAAPEPKPAAPAPKPAEATPKPATSAPAKSEGSSGGMNLVGCVEDAVAIVKGSLVPCVLLPFFMILPVLRELAIVNFMTAVKAAKAEGKEIGIGDLLKFDRLVDKFVGVLLCEICIAIGSVLLFVPGLVAMVVLAFVPCILVDKPEISFMNAFKGGLSYGKANLMKQFVLASVIFGFNIAGLMLLGLGIFITLPITLAVTYLAYENCKNEVTPHLEEQEAS